MRIGQMIMRNVEFGDDVADRQVTGDHPLVFWPPYQRIPTAEGRQQVYHGQEPCPQVAASIYRRLRARSTPAQRLDLAALVAESLHDAYPCDRLLHGRSTFGRATAGAVGATGYIRLRGNGSLRC